MTTEPTGPANTEDDPLGPSAPQPEPTGGPRTPGPTEPSDKLEPSQKTEPSESPAGNIREAQGTSPGGTVPAGAEDEDALVAPESADG